MANFTIHEKLEQRFKNTFLDRHTYLIPTIVLVYLVYVKYLGPWMMKNREPFKLNKVLIVYNAAQVVWCAYALYGGFHITAGLSYSCSKPDSMQYLEPIIIFSQHYFYMKLFDLLDTIFFVLRKKFNQITHLHVYHHAGMVLISYYVLIKDQEPKLALLVASNLLVHFIMYSYYLLTAYIKDHKKILWWKKYITQLQMLQFFVNFVVYTQLLLRRNCYIKTHIILLAVTQNIYMAYLFGKFYYNAYIKKNV